MSTSRREFLKLSAIAGSGVGLGLMASSSNFANSFSESMSTLGRAPKPLNILILGGTGFTGPFQVKYALSRGHKVTVFNRGKTHPGELPKEVGGISWKLYEVEDERPTAAIDMLHESALFLDPTGREMRPRKPVFRSPVRWRQVSALDPV